MEVKEISYYGWRGDYRTLEKRSTYDYPSGNDVVSIERRSYLVISYNEKGKEIQHSNNISNNIDLNV